MRYVQLADVQITHQHFRILIFLQKKWVSWHFIIHLLIKIQRNSPLHQAVIRNPVKVLHKGSLPRHWFRTPRKSPDPLQH